MIRLLAHRLLLVCAACFLIFGALDRLDEAPPPLPLVHADYPVCVTVRPAPISPPRRSLRGGTPLSEIV